MRFLVWYVFGQSLLHSFERSESISEWVSLTIRIYRKRLPRCVCVVLGTTIRRFGGHPLDPMLYYGQIKLDWQCEPFLWLPAVCSSASAPQGTLFVQPAHHSVCTWSLSAAPHLPYIHDDILRLLHPIPSLSHSQCLSMNGSDIMNNSRRTGRPISYWSFRPHPPPVQQQQSVMDGGVFA